MTDMASQEPLRQALEQIVSLRLDCEELIVPNNEFYRGVKQGMDNAKIIARAALTTSPPSVGMSPEQDDEVIAQFVVRDGKVAVEPAVASPVTCAWREIAPNVLRAGCKDMWQTPLALTAWKHCPYCGKPLSLTSDRKQESK